MTSAEVNTILMKEPIITFTIPDSLHHPEAHQWRGEEECCPDYQINAIDTDIGAMLEHVRHEVPRNALRAIEEANESPLRQYSEYFSFFDLPKGRKHFTSDLGSIKISGPILPEFSEFYERTVSGKGKIRLFMDKDGQITNRGKNYFIAIDNKHPTPSEKVTSMNFDIMAAANLLQSIDRDKVNNPEMFLQYLGVMDYLKQHSLCLFHAITYPERFVNFEPDENYEFMKQTTWEASRQFTRAFYQVLHGLPFDDFNLDETLKDLRNTWETFVYTTEPKEYQFKLQEIDHPLILSLAAFQTVGKYPEADHLICLPSGGTQFGFVTELMYEYVRKDMGRDDLPRLIPLALSTHAGKKGNGSLVSREILVDRLVGMHLYGREAIILDDNSNTGETIQMAADALVTVGMPEVHASLAELDPHRIIHKQTDFNPPSRIANYWHPEFIEVATSITPILKIRGGRDQQMRKMIAYSVVDGYA